MSSSTCELNNSLNIVNNNNKKEPVKLKFGIDRLLAADQPSLNKDTSALLIAKPLPTIAVPCSDCVTSLFRCCRLSGGGERPNHVLNFTAADQPHHGFSTGGGSASIYTIQPIRPFATRPGT